MLILCVKSNVVKYHRMTNANYTHVLLNFTFTTVESQENSIVHRISILTLWLSIFIMELIIFYGLFESKRIEKKNIYIFKFICLEYMQQENASSSVMPFQWNCYSI